MKNTQEIQAEFEKLNQNKATIESEMLRLQGEYRYAYQLEQEKLKEETKVE